MTKRASNILLTGILCFSAAAQDSVVRPDEELPLTQITLRELRNVEVTSVSRKEELLLQAPSAVYVLDERDILRSGARSIPEALRMVPGLNVARVNANKWAISSRGFNGRYANKLLVLIDGRAVYTPVFSGTYWDVQDTLLEDIEQIEVIRGPGGTVWGANAVNGVINILTKDARETQGLLVTGGIGTEEEGFAGIRYGGKLAEDWYYRVYAKVFNRDDFKELDGTPGGDEWWQEREGFRADWIPSEEAKLTLQGDFYYGRSGDRAVVASPTPPFLRSEFEKAKATGLNVLARWSRQISSESDYSVQAYYDRTDRESLIIDAEVDTFDVEFQHRFRPDPRHELIWGVGYRLVIDDIQGSYSASYEPGTRHDQILSFFVQDEWALIPERLFLTAGTKLEHDDYTGFEWQPSGRLRFSPTERQTFWASISRAVRTPSRFEHDATANVALPATPTVVGSVAGNPDVISEELIAYEVGYRVTPAKTVFIDLTLFYHDYDHLRASERGAAIPGMPVIIPLRYGNELAGEAYGLELAPTWQVTENWRLSGGYSLLEVALHRTSGSTDPGSESAEGDSPEHQVHIRSFLDLPGNFQLDCGVYYVDSLTNQDVPSYWRLDARLGWNPRPNLELSLAFLNLLDVRHPEFGATVPFVTPTEIERSLYGKVTWRF